MFRKFSKIALIITLALSVGLAQQPVNNSSGPNVDRLRQHVTYLASDALEGRRTGSSGANDAARYIAGEFSRLGLRPAIQGARPAKTRGETMSRYRQNFPYIAGVELGKNNKLSFTSTSDLSATDFQVGEDWMPLGLSSSGHIDNEAAVFVGYGITASEQKYDDYGSGNAAGKIAIVLSGSPDGNNPHGQFAYEDVRWKAIAARNARAKALIIIALEESFRDDRLSKLYYDHGAGDAGLPVVAISRRVAARLFEANGLKNFDELPGQVSRALAQHSTKEIRGYTVTSSNSFDLLNATKFTLSADIIRREVAAANVIGILEGSDPTLKNEAIVIGAHYDHLGLGGEGSLAPREGEIHHGADDNASGVAGVLELARIFTAQRPRPRRAIVFIAFSGEEEGLLGSNYYVNHPIVPLANTVAMINMDMIGRMKDNKLIVGGVGTAQEWRSIVERANPLQGLTATPNGSSGQPAPSSSLPIVVGANGRIVVAHDITKQFLLTLNEDGFGPSDHSSFYAKKVPVLFLWTGTHEDYHKPSDTADKINYEDEARILGFVARLVHDIDTNNKRPVFAVAKSESTGRAISFRVSLGTIPNYADSSDGLLLDGVRDDSPAAKAGIKAGDRIVKLAGREVHNIYDYTYALGEMKAGQEYELELMRGSERIKLKITPAERK